MSSPKKRSPCQRYNKETDECDTCTPTNNKVPFRNCVKYNEYKGTDLLLELVWRVYQLVECMDLECRELKGEGHRLRLVYIFRELHKVHGMDVWNMIKESFLNTFGNVLGHYYYNWLVIELEGEEKLPEDLKIDEDYEEYPVNIFEVLEVEEEPEDYFTPTIDYNELIATRQKQRKQRDSQETSNVPRRFLNVSDDDVFSTKNKFLKFVIERMILFNVYVEESPELVYRAIDNYPDNIFLPMIYYTALIRIMTNKRFNEEDSMRRVLALRSKYDKKIESITRDMAQSDKDSGLLKQALYGGQPTSTLTLLIFRYTEFVGIEYKKKLNEIMMKFDYSVEREDLIRMYVEKRKLIFKEIIYHKDAIANITRIIVDMFGVVQQSLGYVYTENDVDDVLMRFINIYLRKSDIKDQFVRGFIFRILKSQSPIMDYNWILQNAPTLK